MLHASCHCGAVRLQIARKPRRLIDCNCSICRRYGALWTYYTKKTLRIIREPDAVFAYVWGHGTIAFYHCKSCGCLTHWEKVRKSANSRIGMNARMMEPEDIAGIRVRKLDGALTWKYLD